MFWSKRKTRSYSEVDDEDSSSDSEPFLSNSFSEKRKLLSRDSPLPWMISTTFLAVLLTVILFLDYPFVNHDLYAKGFATEIQAGIHVIELEERRFWGGFSTNPNGTFSLHLNPDEPKYVGTPTKEMDLAWHRLIGNFIPLSKEEVETVQGEVTETTSGYLVATSVQHSLHCLDQLRQSLYSDYYPDIRQDKPKIPNYWMHIDHCIDTLRQVLECNGDLTPVPKAWNADTEILLANTEMVHTCRKFDKIVEWTLERGGSDWDD